jgi:hypothetical protein
LPVKRLMFALCNDESHRIVAISGVISLQAYESLTICGSLKSSAICPPVETSVLFSGNAVDRLWP